MREFEGGATRNSDAEKPDFEGFLSPLALDAYSQYMHKHRKQADGKLRDSDNWQKGIPLAVYMKSLWRHFFDLWSMHRGCKRFCPDDDHELTKTEAACSILFNVMGYLHETIKAEASPEKFIRACRERDALHPITSPGVGIDPTKFHHRASPLCLYDPMASDVSVGVRSSLGQSEV